MQTKTCPACDPFGICHPESRRCAARPPQPRCKKKTCPECPDRCVSRHAAQPLTPPDPRVTDAEYVAALHRHGNPPDEALHIVSLPHELRRWARRTLALLLAALAVGLAAGYWSGGA